MSKNFAQLGWIVLVTFVVGTLSARSAAAIQLALLYDYENSGSLGQDVSGNGNNGTITGTVTSAAGRNGGSLGPQFPGIANNNLSRGALAGGYTGTPGVSFMSWIYVDSTNAGSYNGIISQGGGTHRLMVGPANTPFISSPDQGGPTALAYNTWYHLAVTKEDTGSNRQSTIYVNGVATANSPLAATGNLTNMSAQSMFVGAGENSTIYPFKGFMDDTAIFGGALTGAEMAAVYNMAVNTTLNYDLAKVNALLELYEAQSGSVNIGSRKWVYATGLTGTPGAVQLLGEKYFVVLDGSGNGVQVELPPAPEPTTGVLLGLGCLMFSRRRARRS